MCMFAVEQVPLGKAIRSRRRKGREEENVHSV